ncbi:ankyrin repeat domain-containing protein 27-like [Coccinella septempunctata]|uniref:ankyrin repeat domain-containing protein 27-like n=1 Tax=Coccinella septempunctata TaxID=41139 RepID=UPI001D076200|nr:ankyrin repeat domain-containing protein 27-like [Coccinella septempunctata]
MNSDYDENLRENIFFMEILEHHSDIIKKAAKEHWIICIPRSGTLESTEIDIDVILDQVLVPEEDGILKISQSCSTLSKKKLQVQKNKIIIEDFQFSLDIINILFKETFYDGKNSSYVVWCVDKPLFLDHPCCTSGTQVLESLPDCIDFLWVESSGQEVLQQIQNLCIKFIETTPNYELEYVQTQKDLIGSLYSRCLQKTLRNPTLRDTAMKNDQFLEKLKLAVETYMQYCLGKKIIFGISTFMVDADTLITKIIKNTEGVKDKYLGISLNNDEGLSYANCELRMLKNLLSLIQLKLILVSNQKLNMIRENSIY